MNAIVPAHGREYSKPSRDREELVWRNRRKIILQSNYIDSRLNAVRVLLYAASKLTKLELQILRRSGKRAPAPFERFRRHFPNLKDRVHNGTNHVLSPGTEEALRCVKRISNANILRPYLAQ